MTVPVVDRPLNFVFERLILSPHPGPSGVGGT